MQCCCTYRIPTSALRCVCRRGSANAEDLLTVFGFEKASDEQAANQRHKAMIAKMKCLKMFPLPVLMYEVGVLLDALGTPEALKCLGRSSTPRANLFLASSISSC